MAKRLLTITIDDETWEIIKRMKKRDMNRSRHINSLLVFSEKCNFIIPSGVATTASNSVIDSGMDEEDKQQPGESDSDYKERMGF